MEPLYQDNKTELYWGDCLELIDKIPNEEIQCVITSPTYWGKRNFTDDTREFGSESLEDYIDKNVNLYEKILHKLRKTGSLFIVIQDSYMGSGISRTHHNHWETNLNPEYIRDGLDSKKQGNTSSVTAHHETIKNKSLCGIPFRIANRLVDLGFIWRELIIWEKPNPMPSNVKDRLRQSCEYILHFVKNRIYTFNQRPMQVLGKNGKYRMANQVLIASPESKKGHTATFPRKIVERLFLAATDTGDTVFEPFLGAGTMYYLSKIHNRKFIGIDICKEFVVSLINDDIKNKKRGLDRFLKETAFINKELLANPSPEKRIAVENQKRLKFFDDLTESVINFTKKENHKEIKITKNPKLKHDGKKYQFHALFEYENKKSVFEIPTLKNFDEKGTGPYYAAIRLIKALSFNLIDKGVLVIPQKTRGQRFNDIITNENRIHIVELNNNIAQNIIENWNTNEIKELIEIREAIL